MGSLFLAAGCASRIDSGSGFTPGWGVQSVVAQDPPPQPSPPARESSWSERVWSAVAADHQNFYDSGTLLGLGLGVGLAGLSANTQLDRDIYEDVLPEWRTEEWREFRDDVLPLGEGTIVLPVLIATSFLAPELGAPGLGEWGERSVRAIAVGALPMLALQRLTGGGRPDDPANTTSSEWEPFNHSNGVSGHAFIGSVPFLTAAAMVDDPWLDGAFYLGSTLVAGARLQGSRHYFSQIVLGWWIGFLATGSVTDAVTGSAAASTAFLPFANEDEVGFVVVHRFRPAPRRGMMRRCCSSRR